MCHLGMAKTAFSVQLYITKVGGRMECRSQSTRVHEGVHFGGALRPPSPGRGLISQDFTDEVLVSWHNLIILGVLMMIFLALDFSISCMV